MAATDAVAADVAAFVGADPADLTLIENATTGVAAVLQFGVATASFALGLSELRPVLGVDGATLGTGIASFIGIVIATPLNYIINNLWTFRDQDG